MKGFIDFNGARLELIHSVQPSDLCTAGSRSNVTAEPAVKKIEPAMVPAKG